jgi:hypothetical protein
VYKKHPNPSFSPIAVPKSLKRAGKYWCAANCGKIAGGAPVISFFTICPADLNGGMSVKG